jgi:hypothetical protein
MNPEVQDAVDVALARYPDLGSNGFGDPRYPFFAISTDEVEIATAIAFLRQCTPIQTPNHSSYGLKHLAERWGESVGQSAYVSNGALLVAAVYLDFVVRRRHDSLNADIGVSVRSLRALGYSIGYANWPHEFSERLVRIGDVDYARQGLGVSRVVRHG